MLLFYPVGEPVVKPLQRFPASYKKDNDTLVNGSLFLVVICLPPEFQTQR